MASERSPSQKTSSEQRPRRTETASVLAACVGGIACVGLCAIALLAATGRSPRGEFVGLILTVLWVVMVFVAIGTGLLSVLLGYLARSSGAVCVNAS